MPNYMSRGAGAITPEANYVVNCLFFPATCAHPRFWLTMRTLQRNTLLGRTITALKKTLAQTQKTINTYTNGRKAKKEQQAKTNKETHTPYNTKHNNTTITFKHKHHNTHTTYKTYNQKQQKHENNYNIQKQT